LFCNLLDLKIDVRFLYSSLFISVLSGLFLLSALVAGSYPAFMLSRFSPIQVMKGRSAIGKSGEGVRRGLTVFQFAISTGLIVFSLGVGAQLRYMHQRDIGLNREQVMVVPITKNIVRHTAAFKQDIRNLTGVQKVSMASFALFQGGWDMVFIKMPGTQEDVGISNMVVDEQFLETLEIQWINAPANVRELASKRQLLLNESGVEKLRLLDRPLGEQLDLGRGLQEIAGTVKDFNFVSLQSPVEGMLFEVVADTVAPRNPGGQLYVRLAPGTDVQGQLTAIEQLFKKYESDAPFDYYFLDEAFDQQHRAERRMGYLFSGFTGVAILLACLGLFGLITFAAERRTKEIGIRKVLGASVAGITGLLAKDFLKLVFVAIAIASPVAYYFIKKWLSDFAYRVDIQWWMFALAGLSAVLVACLTLAFQAVKAALADPVKSLRSE
jgi:putative ABC transport system permease protein